MTWWMLVLTAAAWFGCGIIGAGIIYGNLFNFLESGTTLVRYTFCLTMSICGPVPLIVEIIESFIEQKFVFQLRYDTRTVWNGSSILRKKGWGLTDNPFGQHGEIRYHPNRDKMYLCMKFLIFRSPEKALRTKHMLMAAGELPSCWVTPQDFTGAVTDPQTIKMGQTFYVINNPKEQPTIIRHKCQGSTKNLVYGDTVGTSIAYCCCCHLIFTNYWDARRAEGKLKHQHAHVA